MVREVMREVPPRRGNQNSRRVARRGVESGAGAGCSSRPTVSVGGWKSARSQSSRNVKSAQTRKMETTADVNIYLPMENREHPVLNDVLRRRLPPVARYASVSSHFRRRNRKAKKMLQEKGRPTSPIFRMQERVRKVKKSTTIIVDSGVSCHMTGDSDLVHDKTPCSVVVETASGERLSATMKGFIRIQGTHGVISVRDVVLVPGLAATVLSVSKLNQKGCVLKFDEHGCSVSRGGRHMFNAPEKHGMYQVEGILALMVEKSYGVQEVL